MKLKITGSLTATLLISALSALPASAQEFQGWQVSPNDSPLSDGQQANETGSAVPSEQSSQAPDSLDQDFSIRQPQESAPSQIAPESSGLSLVNAHALEGRQAATLYISNIPLLTFLGSETEGLEDSSADKSDAVASAGLAPEQTAQPEPVVRATSVGSQLDQLHENGLDAQSIGARWDADQEKYVITVAGEDLITLDEQVMLPDTTQNPAEDALQVANRLRRLLGGAEPITEIEGRPEPVAPPVQQVAVVSSTLGLASWYGPGFHGRQSASGERFNQNALTAAHRTLPFGTRVRVTNVSNGRQVVVRINDRGPFSGGRVIDLSAGAARQIGLVNAGVGQVRMEVLR
ncbi:MAG: septal ring lytic transglycosylase RlpA family protein [Cyanobacteria bacterium P01_D01_bin.44]